MYRKVESDNETYEDEVRTRLETKHTPIANKPASLKLLLRVREVAEMLSMPCSSIYLLISTGELKSMQIGRRRRIRMQDLLEFIDRMD